LNETSTFDYGQLRKTLRDFAFLDVFVIGLLVACALTSNVHDLQARPAPGLVTLLCAAACQSGVHYLAQSQHKETPKSLV
jgi:hypothetical protein